jgi:aminopeptidase N
MRLRVVAALGVALAAALPSAAQQLPSIVRPEHYDLTFVVDLERERFDGTETIRVQTSEPTARVVLNAVDLQLREVTIGSGASAQKAAVTIDQSNQTATLTVAKAVPKGVSEIHVRFSGVLNDQLRGFYISKANNRKYAVTQFEATDARRAFPCFDEPAYKATFAVTVTLDRGDIAISNGKVLSDTPGPRAGQHTMAFGTTPKMSSYLVAIAVGDFQCLNGSAENVPVRICSTPDKISLGHIALDEALQLLTFYNGYYAIKYPFGKLDVVAVPDFAAGAMENTGAIFYREVDLLADSSSASVGARKRIAGVLAHEMAHQWFGDLVTMQWWDDLWLNEGFATWMANKPLAAAHADWNIGVDEAVENQRALELDALRSTRPIHANVQTPSQIDEIFDAITYEKGASVLRMIESYVGEATFRRGVNAYLEAHAYGNATSEDFWKAIADTSGKPIERILPTFVNQPGVPVIDVSLACTGNRTAVTLRQQRFLGGPRGSGGSSRSGGEGAGERWQVPICIKAAGRSAPVCEVLSDPSRTITLAGPCVSWVFANAGAQGYYRTAHSSDIVRAIAPRVAAELTPAERLSLIGDEWALVRAGRHSMADYLTLVAGYGGEQSGGVLEEVTTRLRFVHDYLATDATRPKLEGFLRSLFRPLLDEVGLRSAATDSDDRRALRAALVSALGTIAEDAELIAEARAALDRSLGGGPPLEPTLSGAIVGAAAMHGDLALFDRLAAAGDRATSPEDRYRYLNALPQFREPALVDRALQRARSAALRSQDAALYLAGFFQNPAARVRAWSFVTAHWKELEPKITIAGGDTRLIAALGAFCDARARDDIKAFTAAHPLPSAVRTVDQTLERIDTCIALVARQGPAVVEWLAGR